MLTRTAGSLFGFSTFWCTGPKSCCTKCCACMHYRLELVLSSLPRVSSVDTTKATPWWCLCPNFYIRGIYFFYSSRGSDLNCGLGRGMWGKIHPKPNLNQKKITLYMYLAHPKYRNFLLKYHTPQNNSRGVYFLVMNLPGLSCFWKCNTCSARNAFFGPVASNGFISGKGWHYRSN